MFLLDDGTVVYSASDLTNAAGCEFAVLRSLDARLGRIPPLELATEQPVARPLLPIASTTVTEPCSSFWIADSG